MQVVTGNILQGRENEPEKTVSNFLISKMHVTIKTLQQKTFTIEVERRETVKAFKKTIEQCLGDEFTADALKLVYKGRVMDDTQPLDTYRIDPKSFVVVFIKKPKPPTVMPPAEGAPSRQSEITPSQTAESSELEGVPTMDTSESDGATRMETSSSEPATTAPVGTNNRRRTASQDNVPRLNVQEEMDAAVSNLMALGFERDQVVRALNSSSNNPDRAAEILLSERPQRPTRNVLSHQRRGSQDGEAAVQDNPLAFLRDRNEFTLIRNIIQQNPHALPQLLEQIRRSNPQLSHLIEINGQAFIDIINEPTTSSGSSASAAQPTVMGNAPNRRISSSVQNLIQGIGQPLMALDLQLNHEEKAAVERLKGLGFPEAEALQAYIACDRNEIAATRFLLEDTG